MALTCENCGALGGTRTPNLLIRSQMLYPLSYERSPCSILQSEPCCCVLKIRGRPYSGNAGRARPCVQGLFRLDPADQVLPADRL